jgi:hypothetical protein
MGGSAGGLLMGAVINMRPELFHGVVAAVPFVDVVTTMLDDTIPLTTFEYEEWGNPHLKEYYDYMLSYSPYDNVEAKRYPNLLVTTGCTIRSAILGANQVGRQIEGAQDGHESSAALHEHGRGPRRRHGSVQKAQGDGHAIRLSARSGGETGNGQEVNAWPRFAHARTSFRFAAI